VRRFRSFVFAITGLVTLPSVKAAAPNVPSGPALVCAIHWQPDPLDTNRFNVEVSGLSAATLKELRHVDWSLPQWQQLLSVYAESADLTNHAGLPAILGSYRVNSDVLRFQPQFPVTPGITYRAIFDPGRLPGGRGTGDALVTAVWQLTRAPSTSSTVVSHVYPSAAVLPENLLKFYLHFSAPMSGGHVYDYIHLRDESGKNVELPFLELDEELWNPAMTRLTLFIDPGRIKRGVRPLEEVGPALQAGKRYTLVIDRGWKDALGNPLKESFHKAFKAAIPDRSPPDPAQWKIRAPKAGTRQPIIVLFPKPMDHALAQRVIRVTNESGELVQGRTELQDEERRWTFVPAVAWPRGPHRLVVETTIEDLAGNNVGKPFEVDVFKQAAEHLANLTVKLPFAIR